MTWFKVDDRMPDNVKVRKAGTAAIGLWTLAGAWSAGNLTDGFVPKVIAKRYDPRLKMARKLVESGLWDDAVREGESGYQFHEWGEWQPSKEDVTARRRANADRVKRFREKKSTQDDAVTNAPGNALRTPLVTPPPSRPGPTNTSKEVLETPPTPAKAAVDEDGHEYPVTTLDLPKAADERKAAPSGYSNDFEAWWAKYPVGGRGKGPKQAAWREYRSALRVKGVNAAFLGEALDRYTSDPNANLEYAPYGRTWLKDRKWEEGPAPARQPNQRFMSSRERDFARAAQVINEPDFADAPQLALGAGEGFTLPDPIPLNRKGA